MGKKMSIASFPSPSSPRTNTEVTALIGQDSTKMVTMALHNPPLPVSPMAVRTPDVQGKPNDNHEGEYNVE